MGRIDTRLGFLGLLIVGICMGCGLEGGDDIPQELLATIDEFYATVEAGDSQARIQLFSEDAIMMPNHWTKIEGREAISEVFNAGMDSVFKIRNREVIDMDAQGDLAFTVNSYDYTYHASGAEPQWHRTKNVHIWKRDSTGRWKLHVDIWNSDVPIDQFSSE